MNRVLEIHVLQNFAPSNLNRDDTGSPKDAVFGGVRRGRISIQCLKRAMREHFRSDKLLDEADLAVRTKRISQTLAGMLVQKGHPEEEAEKAAVVALGGLELKVTGGKSQYLVFLGKREIGRIAELIDEHWDSLVETAPTEGKTAKAAKKAAKAAVPPELVKSMKALLDGGRAVDVALFGRMLADLPEKNQDAAAQVAHAISTHKVEREFDFYTAVDDLQPNDNAGADMLGTVEFDSACYYRYGLVDIEKLEENLQQDRGLALKGVEAFLRASIFAEPTGKQNSFAAHNPPSFVVFAVRQSASPRSMANAFESPVRPGPHGLVSASVQALAREWRRLDEVYGQTGCTAYVDATGVPDLQFPGSDAKNVGALIERTMEHVRRLMEG
jgi:CRISPR system Cascade subunit CasC